MRIQKPDQLHHNPPSSMHVCVGSVVLDISAMWEHFFILWSDILVWKMTFVKTRLKPFYTVSLKQTDYVILCQNKALQCCCEKPLSLWCYYCVHIHEKQSKAAFMLEIISVKRVAYFSASVLHLKSPVMAVHMLHTHTHTHTHTHIHTHTHTHSGWSKIILVKWQGSVRLSITSTRRNCSFLPQQWCTAINWTVCSSALSTFSKAVTTLQTPLWGNIGLRLSDHFLLKIRVMYDKCDLSCLCYFLSSHSSSWVLLSYLYQTKPVVNSFIGAQDKLFQMRHALRWML